MADTYRKVYLHVVFAVKNRNALLDKSWRLRLFAYTSKMLTNRGNFALAVNGYHDHVHLFFDYSCKELIEDLVREVKKSMSNFIKEKIYANSIFSGNPDMQFFQ
jgi:REP element-mobilizing transposase RayT